MGIVVFLYFKLKKDFEKEILGLKTSLEKIWDPLFSIKERVTDLSLIKQDLSRIIITEEMVRKIEKDLDSLTKIFLSRKAGIAGEKGVEEILKILPPHLLVKNLKISSYEVEFAIKFSQGKYLPIDSKFINLDLFQKENLTKEEEKELTRYLIKRARELSEYVKDEKTIGIALMVVPDRIYDFLKTKILEEVQKEKIIITPYGLLLPVILFFMYLWERFGKVLNENVFSEIISRVERYLYEIEKDVEQLSKELKSVENLYVKIRTNFLNLKKEIEKIKEKG